MLTVIAGYTLLLSLNGALSDVQRRQQHRDLIQALVEQVSAGQAVPEAWKGIGLEVSLLAQGADKRPAFSPLPLESNGW